MKRLLLPGMLALLLTHPPDASAQMKLSPVVTSPGGTSSAGSIQMLGVVGQPMIGNANDATLSGNFGFVFPAYDYVVGRPTPVFFANAAARIVARSVMVTWTVPRADGLTGFNVYRRQGEEGALERLNPDPLPLEEVMEFVDQRIRPATTYEYLVKAVDQGAERDMFAIEATTPAWKSELEQNYPNPFNPSTTISFYLAESGTVALRVFNVKGQLVSTLLNEQLPFGKHEMTWDGTSDRGSTVASGVYFYRLTTRGDAFTKRMMLLK